MPAAPEVGVQVGEQGAAGRPESPGTLVSAQQQESVHQTRATRLLELIPAHPSAQDQEAGYGGARGQGAHAREGGEGGQTHGHAEG